MGYDNAKIILSKSVLELRRVFQSIAWLADDGQTMVVSVYNKAVG